MGHDGAGPVLLTAHHHAIDVEIASLLSCSQMCILALTSRLCREAAEAAAQEAAMRAIDAQEEEECVLRRREGETWRYTWLRLQVPLLHCAGGLTDAWQEPSEQTTARYGYQLLEQLLKFYPEERCTAAQALDHHFLSGFRECMWTEMQPHPRVSLSQSCHDEDHNGPGLIQHTLERLSTSTEYPGVTTLAEHPHPRGGDQAVELPSEFDPPKRSTFELFSHLNMTRAVRASPTGAPAENSEQEFTALKKSELEVPELRAELNTIEALDGIRHSNVVHLSNLYQGASSWYFVTPKCETTLHRVISSEQPLSILHVQYFAVQLVCAVHALHSAGMVLGHLTPSSVYVNANCDLRLLCDSTIHSDTSVHDSDECEFASLCYKAPELVLSPCYATKKPANLWAGNRTTYSECRRVLA